MARGPRSARAVLHRCLVGLRIGDEFAQTFGGQILASEQDQRCLRDEHDRREICRSIVQWGLIERLICGMGAEIAEHELIAVRRRFRHARGAGHSARAADIFDNDLLAQDLGKAWGEDTSDGVRRTARGEWNDHGHWPSRPILRERRRDGAETDDECNSHQWEQPCHLSLRPKILRRDIITVASRWK